MTSKWTTVLSVIFNPRKFLDDNVEENLHDLGYCDDSLDKIAGT